MKKYACNAAAALTVCVLALVANAQEEDFEPVDLPVIIAEKTQGIDQSKIDFLRGEGALNFAERHDILFARLEDKSPETNEAYIDAMMRVIELLKFDPEKDMASIPLNTESPYFNYWKTQRPAELGTPRPAGPISVQRYLHEGPKQGIPTFFNMPIELTPEDLVADKVEVAIMGIGMDTGSGYRGAAYAPRALRSGGIYLGTGSVNDPNMHTMVSAFNELTIVDYGDIAVDYLSLERSLEHVITKVHEVAAAGVIPMIVGGDHSLDVDVLDPAYMPGTGTPEPGGLTTRAASPSRITRVR